MTSTPGTPHDRSDARVFALDGLRGFAAVVVLACHLFEYTVRSEGASVVLLTSPLGLLVNGPAAVHLFFVLSGWVLALSLDRDPPSGRLPRFYVRRLLRIHPPYVAGLLFAWAASVGYPALGAAGSAARWGCFSVPAGALTEALAFPSFAYAILPVAWSLQVELLMSALFPLLFWLGRRVHPLAPVALGLACLRPLPVSVYFLGFTLDFALGLALYLERARLARWAARLGGWGGAAAVLLAWALLASPYPVGWQQHQRLMLPGGAHTPLVVLVLALGAALLLLVSLHVAPLRRALETPAANLLGRLSYGVYLVHFTILTGVVCQWSGGLLRPGEALLLFPLLLGFSLMVAELLHRSVELPSIRAGRALGAAIARRLGRREPAPGD